MSTPSRNTPAPTSGLSRPRLDTTKFGPLVTLGLCGLLAGLVLAVAAFPAVALTGLSAKAASDSFQNLPDTLQEAPIPQTSMLYASNGSYITSFYDENRVYVALKDVPKVMQNAMIAAEDKRFYQHHGVDAQGVLRALVVNKQAGEVQQGASTLTQQLVKNTLLYAAKTEEERKAAIASTSRQIGQTLGVAVVGSLVSASLQTTHHLDFASASRAGWWVLAGCGAAVLVLGVVATTPWARITAERTAASINPEYLDEHAA